MGQYFWFLARITEKTIEFNFNVSHGGIMNIFKIIRMKYLQTFKPIKYARLIGVNFPNDGVHIYGKVNWSTEPWIITLGKNVFITDGCKFITHDGGTLLFRNQQPDLDITKPIVVGDNVYFGNNVIVLPGVTIGNNVVIGAGSIVTKNIPDNSVVAGVPAKIIKTSEEYFRKIKLESNHLGELSGKAKDDALKKYYKYSGKTKGIYF